MSDELVQVYMGREIEAELIAANLQGHGIPAAVRRSGASAAYPGIVGALGETRVFVAAEHVDDARALMGSSDDDEPPNEEDQPTSPVRATILRWIIAVMLVTIVSALLAGVLRTLIP